MNLLLSDLPAVLRRAVERRNFCFDILSALALCPV